MSWGKNIFLLILFFLSTPVLASEKIKVVVTIPVLKDFVEVIGKDRVEVKSLITGMESEHTYTPKPSDIIALKKARIFFEVGLGLEIWVKSLIKNSDNKDLLMVTTSEGITVIEDEENHGSESGHDHHLGNPHVWLDPENAKMMIDRITEGLSRADNLHQEEYRKNRSDYFLVLDRLTLNLQEKIKNFKNRKIISYHPAWPYFARRFGLEIAGNIIHQAGTEPSAKHIGMLISKIKKENIRVIVSEPQLNRKFPEMMAKETGAKVVILSPINGAIPGTSDYLSLMEYNAGQLINALNN